MVRVDPTKTGRRISVRGARDLALRLWAVYSPDRERVGERLGLSRRGQTFGRGGDGVAQAFDDGLMSRQHALIAWDAARRIGTVADQGSRNGTFVDGAPCSESTFGAGSVLRIGDTCFVVCSGGKTRVAEGGLLGRSQSIEKLRR